MGFTPDVARKSDGPHQPLQLLQDVNPRRPLFFVDLFSSKPASTAPQPHQQHKQHHVISCQNKSTIKKMSTFRHIMPNWSKWLSKSIRPYHGMQLKPINLIQQRERTQHISRAYIPNIVQQRSDQKNASCNLVQLERNTNPQICFREVIRSNWNPMSKSILLFAFNHVRFWKEHHTLQTVPSLAKTMGLYVPPLPRQNVMQHTNLRSESIQTHSKPCSGECANPNSTHAKSIAFSLLKPRCSSKYPAIKKASFTWRLWFEWHRAWGTSEHFRIDHS